MPVESGAGGVKGRSSGWIDVQVPWTTQLTGYARVKPVEANPIVEYECVNIVTEHVAVRERNDVVSKQDAVRDANATDAIKINQVFSIQPQSCLVPVGREDDHIVGWDDGDCFSCVHYKINTALDSSRRAVGFQDNQISRVTAVTKVI